MKIIMAVLLSMSLLLTGCGAAAAPATEARGETQPVTSVGAQAAPETEEAVQAKAASFDLAEGETVDDSMTFRWYYEYGKKDLDRYVAEDILPQYVEKWFQDGEILDQQIGLNIADSVSGWVLIAGTPKEDMGWNSLERQGKTAYCRRIQVTHIPHSQNYHLEKTQAMPDLRYPDSVVNPDITVHESIDDIGLRLPKILRAELYVRSLDRCFVLDDPEKLEILQKATTLPPQVRDWTFRGGLPVEGVGNPLVLDLEGQGQRMFLTDPAGGAGSDLWSCHLLLMPMSIFDLFDVPLEPRGYSRDEKGNTLILHQSEKAYESVRDQWEFQFTLDPRGNLIDCLDLSRYDDPFMESRRARVTFTYDDQDRMTLQTWDSGENESRTEYSYDQRGRLCRRERIWGEYQEVYIYEYDDQDRLTAKVGLDADGKENPSDTVCFWYDDQGGKHAFWFAHNGEPQGDPPETPIRRKK